MSLSLYHKGERMLSYLILVHLIVATPQLNLHHTNWVSQSQRDNTFQHNCLRISVHTLREKDDKNISDIMLFFLSELPSKFHIQTTHASANFTFAELSQYNITSEDLYEWSTPIDIIEDYQQYLNEMSTSNHSALAKQIYHNCSMLRFGPLCHLLLCWTFERCYIISSYLTFDW